MLDNSGDKLRISTPLILVDRSIETFRYKAVISHKKGCTASINR